jgi:hypothetical protein
MGPIGIEITDRGVGSASWYHFDKLQPAGYLQQFLRHDIVDFGLRRLFAGDSSRTIFFFHFMAPEAISHSRKPSGGGYLGPPRLESNDSAVHFKHDEPKLSDQLHADAEACRHPLE